MAENKRFTSDIHRIFDNDEEIACADTMDDAEILVDRLNKQNNRIKELEQENKIHLRGEMWLLRFLKVKGFTEDDVIKFKEHMQKQDRDDDNDGKS